MNRKIFNGMSKSNYLAAALGACMLFSAALPAQALTLAPGLTESQINAIISLLQSFGAEPSVIANVKAALGGQTTTPTTSCININRNLTLGTTGSDVTDLQNYLIAKGYLAAGYNTGYYGYMTVQAVGKLQLSLGLVTSANDPAYGLVGPLTRGKIGCGTQLLDTSRLSTSPSDGAAPLEVVFRASVSCNDVDGLRMDFGDGVSGGGFLSSVCTTGINQTHVYQNPGTYTARLYIPIHDCGQVGTLCAERTLGTATITVIGRSSTQPSCTLSAKPYTLVTGERSVLSWTSKNAVKAKWQQDSAANVLGLSVDALPTSGSETITAAGKGSQTAILLVTGSDGTTASCSTTLHIEATSSSIFSASPTYGITPLNVTFRVAATDSDANSGVYYTIVYGDGEAGGFARTSNPTMSHTYANPGTYTAVLTRNTQCGSWECIGPSTTVGSVTITATGLQY